MNKRKEKKRKEKKRILNLSLNFTGYINQKLVGNETVRGKMRKFSFAFRKNERNFATVNCVTKLVEFSALRVQC